MISFNKITCVSTSILRTVNLSKNLLMSVNMTEEDKVVGEGMTEQIQAVY